jgi:adenylylsulfate kinase-like enzyme
LWGMGGIGKSTLARELYNQLSKGFVASCYEDIKEKVLQGGVVRVQNCILKDLGVNGLIEDKSKGKIILEERLC